MAFFFLESFFILEILTFLYYTGFFLAPEMYITKETKRELLCCCHDNSFDAGPVLIKTEIPNFYLNQREFTPANLMVRVRQYGNHVCSKQDPLSHFKGLKMRLFGFCQKETGAKKVSIATTLWVSFGFFCDVHFWCHV